MKRFSLPIPSAWRNPKRRPIPTHAELVERVAALMERVARQDVRLLREAEEPQDREVGP